MSWCNNFEESPEEEINNYTGFEGSRPTNKACPRRRRKYCCPAAQLNDEVGETSEASRLLNRTVRSETASPDLVAELEAYMASRLFHKYILSEKDFVEVTTKPIIFLLVLVQMIYLACAPRGGKIDHVTDVIVRRFCLTLFFAYVIITNTFQYIFNFSSNKLN